MVRLFTATGHPGRYWHGMQANLDGAVYGLNAALPYLRARGGGAILITSSLAGTASAADPYYSAAKHALIGLTRSFALIPRKDNITVNAICPGFIDTRLVTTVSREFDRTWRRRQPRRHRSGLPGHGASLEVHAAGYARQVSRHHIATGR